MKRVVTETPKGNCMWHDFYNKEIEDAVSLNL